MTDNWQQTDHIVMSVQTAELHQTGIGEKPTLNLSCSLVNIARGQCMLEIEAGNAANKQEIGSLVIEIDRPVMRGRATIPQNLYDSLLARLSSTSPRPISLSLSISTKLAVSLEGDLRIDDETIVTVTDIAATLPLR